MTRSSGAAGACSERERRWRHTALRLARAAEAKDAATGGHLERLHDYSCALGEHLGFTQGRARLLGLAAMVHDVGKLAVPAAILRKPGPLDADELLIVRQHPVAGVRILGELDGVGVVRDVVRWHHERWDGSGYPDGLRGEQIPLHAAIVAVADVFDALVSVRSYKPAWDPEAALSELERLRGIHFHPDVVDALRQIAPSMGCGARGAGGRTERLAPAV